MTRAQMPPAKPPVKSLAKPAKSLAKPLARPSAASPAGDADPVWPARLPLWVGFLSLAALVGGLGVWSAASRIAGAVMAPGVIEVESNRQVIQHPDGGVVGEILVKDGDRVAAGDVLLRLDGSRTRSELAMVQGQLRDLAARQARLEAERDGRDALTAPALVGDLGEGPDFIARLASEKVLFRARLEALAQESGLIDEQTTQIGNRITGTRAQLDAVRHQADLLAAALADQKKLLSQGLAQASRALDLERELTGAQGQIGQLTAQIADLQGQVSANAIARLQLVTKRREEAVTQLRDVQAKTYELGEQALALQDVMSRLEIRAPVAGIVYGSRIFAVHAVVQRAEPIMYIIPQDQPLVVAARVDATHIDDIRPGQPVSLRFSSFDQRETAPVAGHLTRISADVVTDEATRASYYAVTIEPDTAALAALGDRALVPGMPVEAFITTGDRSPLSYLLHPLTVYFDRAFRE